MNQRALASLMAVSLVLGVAACGDDADSPSTDDAGKDDGTAGMGSGHMDKDASTGPSDSGSGNDAAAPGEEGSVCTATRDCAAALRCIQAASDQVSIGICARPCASREQCHKGEICYAYTRDPNDAHCVNLVEDTYALCGVGETSRCDGHTCLYFPAPATVGLCVDLCDLTASASDDAGTPEDDGGVASHVNDAGVLLTTCTRRQTCIKGVVDSTTEGLCGVLVAPGEKCGVPAGRFCGPGYGCRPDDLEDESGPQHCRQDCSKDGKCAKGTTCKGIVGQTAFCY
jgi:hypothetical protein